MFQNNKSGKRWTWKSPNGVMKTEIDYILANRPDIVIDITFINQVNIGIDHRLVMSNIKLDVEMGWGNNDNQEATQSRCHINRNKEDRISN